MILAKRLAPPTFAVPAVLALLISLASAPGAQAAPAAERWSPIGPQGGTVTALAVAPGARRTVYAGTVHGAIYRSTDAGAHWAYAGTNLTISAVADLEVDPRAPATVYAGSCEFNFEPPFRSGGVLKSTDGGRSWALLDVGIEFECHPIDLAIDPHDPDTVFAATPSGLFETHDAGATWQLNPGLLDEAAQDSVAAVSFHPAVPGTLYILQGRFGFQKSTDGGASWTTLGAGLPDPRHLVGLELDPRAPGTLYVRIVDAQDAPDPALASVYRSDDGGATWAAAAAGLGGRRVNDLAAARAVATLYAATADGVFRSQDGGRTWSGPVPGTAGALAVAAPPSPAGIVYAGTHLRGVLKSADRGGTWRTANRGLLGLTVSQLAIARSNPAVFYASVLDFGVLRSDDAGVTWRPADAGLNFAPWFLTVDPRDPQTAFTGPFQGGLWKTSDGGDSWRAIAGDIACIRPAEIVFDPRQSRTLYTFGARAFCQVTPSPCRGFKSIDGGDSWTCMADLTLEVSALAIDPARPAALFAGGFTAVQATTDGGRTWNDASAGLPVVTVQSLALTERAPGIVFAGTSRGLFRRLGGLWSPYLPALFTTWTDLTVAPSDPGILYAVLAQSGITNRSRLFRSVDAGTTWRRVTEQGLPPGQEIGAIVVDPARPRVLYTLTRGGIYRLSRPPARPLPTPGHRPLGSRPGAVRQRRRPAGRTVQPHRPLRAGRAPSRVAVRESAAHPLPQRQRGGDLASGDPAGPAGRHVPWPGGPSSPAAGPLHADPRRHLPAEPDGAVGEVWDEGRVAAPPGTCTGRKGRDRVVS